MGRGFHPQTPVKPGFWSPLQNAGPRLRLFRDSIIHDPVRRSRLKALFIGESTIVGTIFGIDWLLRSHAIPFNVWTCEQTWDSIVGGFLFFVISYIAPWPASLIHQKHFQRGILLLLCWFGAIQFLCVFALALYVSIRIYPNPHSAPPILLVLVGILHYIGPVGMLAASYLIWLGPVAAILFYFKNKWQREMKREIASRTSPEASLPPS